MTAGSLPVICAAWIKVGTQGARSYAIYKFEKGAS